MVSNKSPSLLVTDMLSDEPALYCLLRYVMLSVRSILKLVPAVKWNNLLCYCRNRSKIYFVVYCSKLAVNFNFGSLVKSIEAIILHKKSNPFTRIRTDIFRNITTYSIPVLSQRSHTCKCNKSWNWSLDYYAVSIQYFSLVLFIIHQSPKVKFCFLLVNVAQWRKILCNGLCSCNIWKFTHLWLKLCSDFFSKYHFGLIQAF